MHTDFDIAAHLNGAIKPYDVCCFMLNLPSTNGEFDFKAARTVVAGSRQPISHHLFISPKLMPNVSAVVGVLADVYSEVEGLHFAEL